jgi:hypothetical protein
MCVRRAQKVTRQGVSEGVSLNEHSEYAYMSDRPTSYVEMLENQQTQLVSGLQELYKRLQNGQGWSGTPLKETGSGVPLTHDILERLGALKQDGHHGSDLFEEDLNLLQQRLIANGATMMQREGSHDGSSESAPSPASMHFQMPFSSQQFPPTPPNQSPYPQQVRAVMPPKSNTYPQPGAMPHSNLSWSASVPEYEEGMDFINHYDSPMMDNAMNFSQFTPQMMQDQAAINSFFTMKDWPAHEEMQRFVNPAMI